MRENVTRPEEAQSNLQWRRGAYCTPGSSVSTWAACTAPFISPPIGLYHGCPVFCEYN